MPSTSTRTDDEAAWRTALREAVLGLRRPLPSGHDAGPHRERRRPVVVLIDGDGGPTAGEVARHFGGDCRIVELGPVRAPPADGPLRWITALQGAELRLIAVEDVCYFRSDHKYTAVLTADGEALIRLSLRELAGRLDPARFWQIHRGTLVNVAAIRSARRDPQGQLELRLKSRPEMLKVSASWAHHFKHL